MKRLLAALLLTICFAGCGGREPKAVDPPPENKNDPGAPPEKKEKFISSISEANVFA